MKLVWINDLRQTIFFAHIYRKTCHDHIEGKMFFQLFIMFIYIINMFLNFKRVAYDSIHLVRSERRDGASKKRHIFSIIFFKESNYLFNASDLTGFTWFLISFSNLSSFESVKKGVTSHSFRPSREVANIWR